MRNFHSCILILADGQKKVKMFFVGMGGRWPLLFWLMFCGALLFGEVVLAFMSWFSGYWAEQYEHHPSDEVPVAL